MGNEMKQYVVNDIRDIEHILDRIHDRHFVFDEIIFDKVKRTLQISITVLGEEETVGQLLFLKKHRMKVFEAILKIHNVQDYDVIDKAQIGGAGINTLYVDDHDLIIECGIPVTIRIRIATLSIELIVTDNIVSEFDYYIYPFCWNSRIDPKFRRKRLQRNKE
jgi:hypothetical protein